MPAARHRQQRKRRTILPSIAASALVEAGVQEINVPFLKHFEREMCLASNARLIRIRPVLQQVATALAQTCRL